jgi:hypothetical protein
MTRKDSVYGPEDILEQAKKAGEAVKRALANNGAFLLMTVESVPEGLSYKYFHLGVLSGPAIQLIIDSQVYQTMAREAEEGLQQEITPTGPVN